MYIKIVRSTDAIAFYECKKFELRSFSDEESINKYEAGELPGSFLDMDDTECVPIYKNTVVYIENNDGKTIEQLHW